ncbi:hypothetical protein DFP73DRAFT_568289 [Morchella snyderi]|nr:hypothetical protein DFP73DRAFT_568289 [Morchella snyderi]
MLRIYQGLVSPLWLTLCFGGFWCGFVCGAMKSGRELYRLVVWLGVCVCVCECSGGGIVCQSP